MAKRPPRRLMALKPRENFRPIPVDFREIVGMDPFVGTMEQLAEKVSRLDYRGRELLLSILDYSLNDRVCFKDESVRVASAKLLVCQIPQSLDLICKCLEARGDRLDFELHFSLFCFLDWVNRFRHSERTRKVILALVAKYLDTIDRSTAKSAWMAGDLLGDHWPLPSCVPVLTRAARMARFAEGRLGALHGLAHALTRTVHSTVTHRLITETLVKVSQTDRSKRIRETAFGIVAGTDPCSNSIVT